jgi:hypothetical protein
MQTCNTSEQRDQNEIQCVIGGYGSGGGSGDGGVMRQSALCLILNKIYSNIAEYDIKLFIALLQIEF